MVICQLTSSPVSPLSTRAQDNPRCGIGPWGYCSHGLSLDSSKLLISLEPQGSLNTNTREKPFHSRQISAKQKRSEASSACNLLKTKEIGSGGETRTPDLGVMNPKEVLAPSFYEA
jgi:hypothetical protein